MTFPFHEDQMMFSIPDAVWEAAAGSWVDGKFVPLPYHGSKPLGPLPPDTISPVMERFAEGMSRRMDEMIVKHLEES